jgi:exopolysaccharide biosynthesis protein
MPSKIINILRIDPKASGVRIAAVLANGSTHGNGKLKGRDTVSSIAKRLNAVAVVNAGFFWQSADPLGLHVSGGELVSEPIPGRAAFGITSDGSMIFDRLEFAGKIILPDGSSFPIKGINRSRGKDELVAYTPRFAATTCTPSGGSEVVIRSGSSPVSPGIPMTTTIAELRPGCGDTRIAEGTIVLSGSGVAADFINRSIKPDTVVTVEFKLKSDESAGWDKVVEAVGGGPWLVRNGVKYIDSQVENIKRDISVGRHSRTAVGATADGKLVIATVGGWRRTGGMTLHELASLMIGQGCTSAINLDGGGSTTMATSLGVLNFPADTTERSIADALAVFCDTQTTIASAVDFTASPDRVNPSLASRAGNYSVSAPTANVVLTSEEFAAAAPSVPMIAGLSYRINLFDSEGQPLDSKLSDQTVWSLSGGVGFVDQRGTFYAVRPGTGLVSARIGAKTAEVTVHVLSAGSQPVAPVSATAAAPSPDAQTPVQQEPAARQIPSSPEPSPAQ